MYFYELLNICKEKELVKSFMDFFDPDRDYEKTEEKVISCIKKLKSMKAEKSENYKITADWCEEGYQIVHAFCEGEKIPYSIIAAPWAEVLGYCIDEQSLEQLGAVKLAAMILWEITWFGFDEETIRNSFKTDNDGM